MEDSIEGRMAGRGKEKKERKGKERKRRKGERRRKA